MDVPATDLLAEPQQGIFAIRSPWPAIFLAIAIFSALSLAAAITSSGFLEADSCSHYLYARNAIRDPVLLVNVWGRPFCTALYAIPAQIGGRLGVRITSLLTAIGIALLARQVARGQGWRWPELALIFTFAQPLVFLHSFSELTELPFALLLGLALLAYQRRQFFWMAVVIGLTPLSRPEGFGFLALAGLALLLHRRPWWIAVMVFPPIAWDWSGWVLYGYSGHWWHWLAENWPYAETSLYLPGPLWHFAALMPVVVSPHVFPATIFGAVLCLKQKRFLHGFFNDHRQRCEILIAAIPLMIFAGHSLLYWRGKMASNGELRYMLVVAPFWALLSARGWGWVFERFNWKWTVRWAGLAAVLPVFFNNFYRVLPLRSQPDWVEAEQLADWYRTGDRMQKFPWLADAHPGVLFYLEESGWQPHLREWKKEVIDAVPPNTLLIWDPIYGVFNSDAQRSIKVDELIKSGWKEIDSPLDPKKATAGWRLFKSAAEAAK